ncbi:hypothetical protein EDB84DRAFT_1510570 [Lactarius hengduanensis]|nr:hypothetical protein EDB84DRAFT_1510570 [Lactarius hengduanensis]
MNPDDDVVNQQSGSSANPQPSPGSPSASSSRHKIGDSLSFASAGVAIPRLREHSANGSLNNRVSAAQYARPLGATLIGLGIAVLGLGTQRYLLSQRALPQGFFPAARLSVFVQAVVFGILIAVH